MPQTLLSPECKERRVFNLENLNSQTLVTALR